MQHCTSQAPLVRTCRSQGRAHSIRWFNPKNIAFRLRRQYRSGWKCWSVPEVEERVADGWNIYDYPQLYEAAFCTTRSFRDEVAFLQEICLRHCENEPSTLLDIGCGPGNHAIEMAKLGFSVFAVDNSQQQLQYAQTKAKENDVRLRFLKQDMRQVHLPEGVLPVDLAIMLFGTMQHLHSIQDIEQCWRCIWKCLKPGGILILELPHFEDIFNSAIMEPQYWETNPEGDGESVIVEYGTEDDPFDPETQILRRRIGVSVRTGNEIHLQGEQYVYHRLFTYQELILHARHTGFRVLASYGDLDSQIDAFHQEAQRLVLVLQKDSNFEPSQISSVAS